MSFSRQEYWSALPFPSPEDLPDPQGLNRVSHMAGRCFTVWATGGVHMHPRQGLCSGHSLWPALFFPWIPAWLKPSHLSHLCSNLTSSMKPTLSTQFKNENPFAPVAVESPRPVWLFCNPMNYAARQTPLSTEFSRQEHWSVLPFPPPGDPLDPVIEPHLLHRQGESLPSEPPRKPSPHSAFLFTVALISS